MEKPKKDYTIVDIVKELELTPFEREKLRDLVHQGRISRSRSGTVIWISAEEVGKLWDLFRPQPIANPTQSRSIQPPISRND